jgi:hypothetical protein
MANPDGSDLDALEAKLRQGQVPGRRVRVLRADASLPQGPGAGPDVELARTASARTGR